ncbi:MAG TPA: hypothetical protein VGL86_33660 [Polyangia bacterium]|jgi:hypothetical protein
MKRASLPLAFAAFCVSLPALAAPARSHSTRAVPDAMTPGTSCNDTPKLGYSNGPLIQHVKVVDVFYSPGFQYKAMLEDYYKAILQSAYFDWLVEYNATNYKISRGTFVMSVEDTNTNPTTVKQVNPETYLKGLVTAGKVPAPDDDTMYMLYFPSGIDPTDGSGPSCISNGDYCAYHSSYEASGGQMARYGVIPDMDAGDCNQGCGPPGFASFTDVSSHELIEAVTDPDGSGWYDTGAPDSSANNCGEIGDICAVGGTEETGTVGGFIVQKEWSNKNNACITTDPNAVLNDFTVAASPAEVMVPVGGSATTTVTLTKKTGVAEPVSLTATPPTGLTASFSPASVTSDAGSSMLTLTASPMLTAGTMLTLTVKGTGSAVSEMATVNVTVVAPADMAMASSGGSGGSGGGSGSGERSGSAGGCALVGVGFPVAGGSAAGSALVALALLALALRRRRA